MPKMSIFGIGIRMDNHLDKFEVTLSHKPSIVLDPAYAQC